MPGRDVFLKMFDHRLFVERPVGGPFVENAGNALDSPIIAVRYEDITAWSETAYCHHATPLIARRDIPAEISMNG